MKSVTRKRYTAEFKAQAVGLVGLGKPVPEVAEDLGIGTSILYGWVRKDSQLGQLGSGGLQPEARSPQRTSCPGCDAKSPTSNWRTTF